MWKWLVGALAVGAMLVCLGGSAGAWWLYLDWRSEQAMARAEAEADARAREAAAAALAAQAERAARLEAARAAAASGDPARTVTALREVLDANPDDVDARLARGRAYALLERYDLAAEDLRVVTRLDPSRSEAWRQLGWVLGQDGQDADAVVAYDRLVALVGDEPKALRDRGNARFRAGDVTGARDDAGRACMLGLDEGCALEARIVSAMRP